LIRLGIHQGEFIKCIQRLPGGTLLVEKNRQEIAIGAALAKAIMVIPANETP
jgi:Fe2+ transport system protein FeoA